MIKLLKMGTHWCWYSMFWFEERPPLTDCLGLSGAFKKFSLWNLSCSSLQQQMLDTPTSFQLLFVFRWTHSLGSLNMMGISLVLAWQWDKRKECTDISVCVKGAHLKNFRDVVLSLLMLQTSLFLPVDQLLAATQHSTVQLPHLKFHCSFIYFLASEA